ncbi:MULTISPECIES: helix-turn-helix domain-containing protein [Haemophilus]|jgi:XRE family transcriptional regulator|uniref:Helix-turn-helix transcriptional regulator n=2 Tax=Haemophilus TaxID=724 RepID=A0A4R6DFE2_HAEHA|nr:MULTISPECIES: helix-turn-helix transcriptional regulator [Haemophilus]KAA5523087.1 helix-turn-helix transcriptional regulator [Haemophilus seminalis]MBS6046881.1 helix-turn-helix transcriptional regulator [Haemophilus haemolyticus]MDK7280779.1 helix-turn-helix transcriptional regulator [Haemophilus seminalis]NYA27098.1 helix-turn-helix transcriptional regulator [Haemophilus haemolyticus]TDN43307.1 putative regulatory protein [Haemophilus haemolyticus]
MNLNHRYINNSQGQPEFVILPIAEYEDLIMKASPFDDENAEEWENIPVEASEDGNELIPNDVVNIMFEQEVSLLAAWRIYRSLSQAEVAKHTGLTQSAISQAERKESKPQKKTREKLAKIYQCKPEQLEL